MESKGQPARGTRDLLGEDARRHRFIEEVSARILASYGYEEIRTPIFETEELFSRAVGEETDIVGKELYRFEDRKGRKLVLRPEGTAAAVRAYLSEPRPGVTRWWYAGPMFRYERPQAGRYRQFHQIGVEIFGAAGPAADLEVIALGRDLLSATGVADTEIRINSLGCDSCRPAFREALVAFLRARVDRLCGDCVRRLETNPLRVLDCKVTTCREALGENAPRPSDHLCADCGGHKDSLEGMLAAQGVPFRFDPTLVRGLDYYTRTVFEVVHTGLGAQDAVLGGGRYDGLVSALGGPSTPAVGLAVGIDRWASLLPSPVGRPPYLDVIPLGPDDVAAAARISASFRSAAAGRLGVRLAPDPKSPRAALRGADAAGVEFVLLVGENERMSGSGKIKRLKDGVEFVTPISMTAESEASAVSPLLDDLLPPVGRLG